MKNRSTFTRSEYKYMITEQQADWMLMQSEGFIRPDVYPQYTLNNLYLDTENDDLIIRSLQKPEYKEKLRMRCYGEPDSQKPVFLEVKKKVQDTVYKRRISLSDDEAQEVLESGKVPEESGQIGRELQYLIDLYHLQPKMFIAYDRCAWTGTDEDDLRITMDRRIRSRQSNLSLASDGSERDLLKPGEVLMEIKATDRIPMWLSAMLTSMHAFRRSYSKYGEIYTQIESEKHHFGPAAVLQTETEDFRCFSGKERGVLHV